MRIGIDLGGTKIEGIVIDARGHECLRRRVDTPSGDYAGTIGAVVGVVAGLEAALGRRATVGVGLPGAISPATGLVKNANSTWLIGKPLDRDLAAALGRPVKLANDAGCFAISEAVDGAGAGARVVFGVILGTGVGGGVVVEGRAITGRNAIGGEWGHNPLPWLTDAEHPGPECYCGKRGCIETFLSGPGFARDFEAATGRILTTAEIVRAAATGDGDAEGALRRYEERLARALATVVNVLDPGGIVFGGGMSNLERLYESVPGLWGEWVFSDVVTTRLTPPRHGDSSGVRGAAWLWPVDAGDAA